jgi:hypothetical protein
MDDAEFGSDRWYKAQQERAEAKAWEHVVKEAVRTHDLGAKKYDSGKPQLSLVPVEALEAIASAMAYGAAKYGKNNYKLGHKWSRCLDAALRHLYALAHGEEIDPESGNTHLSHALASLSMLSYHIKHHPDLNDLWETTDEQT